MCDDESDLLPPELDDERNKLWPRYQELLIREVGWKKLSHGARSKLARQLETLFEDSKDFDSRTRTEELPERARQQAWFCIRTIWTLVASLHRQRGNLGKAIELLEAILVRDPSDGNALERLLRVMLEVGNFAATADLINSAPPSAFAQNQGSNSAQIIEWAMTYDEFAAGLSEERLKYCVRCVAQKHAHHDVKVKLEWNSSISPQICEDSET